MKKRTQLEGLIICVLLIQCYLILLTYNQFHKFGPNSIAEITKRPDKVDDGKIFLPHFTNKKPWMDSERNRLKTIFIWNRPERIESVAGFGTGHQPFIDHGCPISNCYIQVNESSEFWNRAIANNSEILKSFDAVVINSYMITYLPNYERPARQRYVWLSQEAPGSKPGFGDIDKYPTKLDRIFNWTMTYKRDSDIKLFYGQIHPIVNRTQNATEMREKRRTVLATKKSKPIVSWMVSDCKTKSRREEYVHQLQEHIQIGVYGDCGYLSCPRGKQWISLPECYKMIEQKYKFYISFENALCKDYVTEKFFSILELDVVPVVFGAADYRSIAPEHSYIDASDFSSPAQLAEYLHFLDENDELYLNYLDWKSRYWVEAGMEKMNRHAFCDLCAKLNREDEPEKVYDSLVPEWSYSTQCRPGWDAQ